LIVARPLAGRSAQGSWPRQAEAQRPETSRSTRLQMKPCHPASASQARRTQPTTDQMGLRPTMRREGWSPSGPGPFLLWGWIGGAGWVNSSDSSVELAAGLLRRSQPFRPIEPGGHPSQSGRPERQARGRPRKQRTVSLAPYRLAMARHRRLDRRARRQGSRQRRRRDRLDCMADVDVCSTLSGNRAGCDPGDRPGTGIGGHRRSGDVDGVRLGCRRRRLMGISQVRCRCVCDRRHHGARCRTTDQSVA